MDIHNSTAIDTVRGLLANDFTGSRATWLHLTASLFTEPPNVTPRKTPQLTALQNRSRKSSLLVWTCRL